MDSSIKSVSSAASISDSIRCNNANKPNKITGEMGLEIYPCPSGKEEVILQYMHDRHFQYIHPNVFVPARVLNVERMGGGGSGVSVFSGTHPILGEIVMKHGGFSDMKELFALGTISTQLTTRGKQNETSLQAASAMKNMLPEFKMVYISPQHVLYKPKAVWGKLKKLAKIGRESSLESFVSLAKKIEMSERHLKAQKSTSSVGTSGTAPQDLITLNDSKFLGPGVFAFTSVIPEIPLSLSKTVWSPNARASISFSPKTTFIRSTICRWPWTVPNTLIPWNICTRAFHRSYLSIYSTLL